jgi:hypothetical protein
MEIILKIVIIGFLVIFAVLFVFSLVIFAVHHKTGGALFVPTPKVMIQKIIDSIDFSCFHDIRELGTGDGRFISAVERTYKRAVVGYEINPVAYCITWLKIRLFGLDSRVEFKNFWEQDLRSAQCIYCYLFPDIMSRLGEKLDGELAEGSRVISANFPIPAWSEESVLHVENSIFNDPIYIYLIGSHKKGNVQESKH